MDKKAYIFDVDGTLYSQTKMRLIMMQKLFLYYLVHFNEINGLRIIYKFRKLREMRRYKSYSIRQLTEVLSAELRVNPEYADNVVKRWMFEEPLKALKKCAYPEVIRYINHCFDLGKQIVIYSDYPALDKINVLKVKVSNVFSAEDETIKELKPSLSAMNKIMQVIQVCNKEHILYVGDRYNKDGKSAELVGIEFMDISQFRKIVQRS